MKNNILLNSLDLIQFWSRWIKKYKWFQFTFNLTLFLLLISFLIYYLIRDWQEISKLSLVFDINSILVAFGFYGINFYLLIIAWHLLLRSFIKSSDFKQNAIFYSYSHLYRFLPTPAWFLASRISLYGQTGMQKGLALNTTLLETLLHMLTGLMLYGFLMIDKQRPETWLFATFFIPVLIIIQKPQWLVFPQMRDKMVKSHPSKKDIIIICLIYLITWIVAGPFFLAVVHIASHTSNMTVVEIFRIWILGSLIAYIGSYTLGGAGILREFSLALLLSKYFYPPMALLITILVRLILLLAGIIWALVTMGFLRFKVIRIS